MVNVKKRSAYFITVFVVLAIVFGTVFALSTGVSAADISLELDKIKTDAINDLNALKNGNEYVDANVKKYAGYISSINYMPDEAAANPDQYLSSVKAQIAEIKAEAVTEISFLNSKYDYIAKLKNDYKAYIASGRYTGESRTKLDQAYRSIVLEIGKCEIEDGTSKLETVYKSAKAKFDECAGSVNVLASSEQSAIKGRVISKLGFNSGKSLLISKQALKKPDGISVKADMNMLSTEGAKNAVTDKNALFTFKLNIDGYTAIEGDDYVVRIVLPEEYRNGEGYQIVSKDKSGFEYAHKTVKYGNVVEFKTSMYDNDFTLLTDVTKNMTWIVVVLAILAVAEIAVTALFVMKKKKLYSFAPILPFLAVVYAPANLTAFLAIFGAVIVSAGAVMGVSIVQYVNAKKEKEDKEAEAETAEENKVAEASEKEQEKAPAQKAQEPADNKNDADDSIDKKGAVIAAAYGDDDEEEDDKSDDDVKEEAKEQEAWSSQAEEKPEKKKRAGFVILGGVKDDEPEEDAEDEEKAQQERTEPSLEDGEYEAYNALSDEEGSDESDTTSILEPIINDTPSDDPEDGEYEADKIGSENSGADESKLQYNENVSFEDGEYEAVIEDDGYDAYSENVEKDSDSKKKTKLAIAVAAADNSSEESGLDDDEDTAEDKTVFSLEAGERVYVTYDYSFESKLYQSTEEVQYRYQLISDTLLSYGLKKRDSWKKERYYLKNTSYAVLMFKGKTLCVCLAIEPESLIGTKYNFEDISSVKKYGSVPIMLRIRSGRACKYAVELIEAMFEKANVTQQRPVAEEFELYPPVSKDKLVEMGVIRVMMTNGTGQIVAADFEAMKNSKFNLVSGGLPVHKLVTAEEVAAIPDENVAPFILKEVDDADQASVIGTKKGIINIDTISDNYNDGDVVTVADLIEKSLIPKNTGYVKVLARGTLDKAITVKAHDFSMDAAKMIVVAGGSVIEVKSFN